MAKQRIVNTRFWDDSYIARLDPSAKLVFLYLLTNPLTTIAGVYELSLKRAAFDTGLASKEIGIVLDQLEADNKIVRQGDWIGIVNFIKHQSLNPKVRLGIIAELERVPGELIDRLPASLIAIRIGFDRPSHSNPNSNPNFNSDVNSKDALPSSDSTACPQDVKDSLNRLAMKMRLGR